jgi:hypothetical protein
VIKTDIQEQERELILAQIAKLDTRLLRAKDAYLAEIDTLDEYKRNKAELETQRQELEAALLREAESPPTNDTALAGFKDNIRNVVELLTSDCDLETKIKAVSGIIQKIVYNKQSQALEVYYYDI